MVRSPIRRGDLKELAAVQFGDFVKAVVDINRGIMAVGGNLHADQEAILLDDGSRQGDLWGINLYPAQAHDDWIEFDSMINIRPAAGNTTRGVDDPALRERITQTVSRLVTD